MAPDDRDDDRDDAAMAHDITPLNDIGKRLLQPNQPKGDLLKLLKQAVGFLCVVDQSPPPATLGVMKACTEALVLEGLMKHKDKDVRLLVATCISEVMRIFAPEAPYDDEVLKDIFQLLVVDAFQGLEDVSSPSFAKRVSILDTVSKVRSCVMMLDLDCDDLILDMFHIFFKVASDSHDKDVFSSMTNILALVLEESEVIAQPLLEAVFSNLLKDRKNVTSAGYKLAVAVIEKWNAHKVEGTEVQRFLTSIMVEGSDSELHEDYHDLFFEIYCCAPEMLLGVIPNLTEELLMDKIDVRLKALKLMGRIFALPREGGIPQEFLQLFAEFVKRFTDKDLEVRAAALECAKGVVLANPGPQAIEIIAVVDGRLLDHEEKARTIAVRVICDLANTNPSCVPMVTVKNVAPRLRDKKFPLRKETLKKLTEVYRKFCSRAKEGSLNPEDDFEWIPSKVIRLIYDKDIKDFRAQGLEVILTEDLFPPDLPVEDRVKHWIAVFSTFDKNDEKALDRILVQKQRLQQEMQAYLSLRQKIKEDDNSELQKKLQAAFKNISSAFLDPIKAEEHLQKLHQMKDNNIFKGLSILLDPNTTFEQSREACEDLLERLRDKHPQYEFMRVLSIKCSFLLFGKEHVKAALKEIHVHKAAGSSALIKASLAWLVEVASVFPSLIEGGDKDLLELLKESDETIKEGVVHILSKAGGTLREQIAEVVSSVDETLEKLCLEGNRKQAKYAVTAISTVTADSGLKTLSLLYGRLVDSLDDKAHLPTILQSLGCIAQLATPVFETREQDIVRYVLHTLLRQSSSHVSDSWDAPSEECQLKIYGLKMLVKSFLPTRDAHSRAPAKLSGLLNATKKLMELGELSEDVQSSEIDKAHIRLAAAKSVLRLASRWDKEIQADNWLSTILTAQDPNVRVRHLFIAKVNQYLKERSLPHKYASAFALCATDAVKAIFSEARKFTGEFISSCRREARARQLSSTTQIEGSALAGHPEYVLLYLVHVLAHHPKYPFSAEELTDASSYEPFQRQLHAYLRALLHEDGESRSEGGKKDAVDNIPAILAIFAEIKRAEDAVDATKSENLYTISDIGIIMTKELSWKKMFSGVYPGEVRLPSVLYKTPEGIEGAESKIDGSHMPPCLLDANGQLKLKVAGTRAQPSSPRVPKRSRRSEDGDSSEDEAGKESEDHVQKRSRNADSAPVVPARAAPSKPHRGRKRSDGPSRAAVKNEQQHDVVPEKKKRGRPRKNPVVVVVEPPHVSDVSATISVENTPDDAEDAPSSKNVGVSATRRLGSTKKLNAENDATNTNAKTPYMGRKAAQKQPGEMSTGRKPKKALETPVTASPAKRRAAEGPKQTPKAKSPKKAETDTPVQGARQTATPASQKTPGLKAKNGQEAGEDLINCRIKVYWPLDKRYYKGRVQDYDPKTRKHRILYDDGDVEQLHMDEERWAVVKEESGRRKRATEAPPTPTSSQTNQRGKLKRRGQTVAQEAPKEDGGSGPEVSRVSSLKNGKEATTDSGGMQYSGGGMSEAKSGGEATSDVKRTDAASSPVLSPLKAAVTSATHSADPFEFDDNDQPLVDKGGGSKQKTHKGTVGDTLKIKRKEKTPLEGGTEKSSADTPAAKSVPDTGAVETFSLESAATKSGLESGGTMAGAETAIPKSGDDTGAAKSGADTDVAKSSSIETVQAKSGGEASLVESGVEEAAAANPDVETSAAKPDGETSAAKLAVKPNDGAAETITETDAAGSAAEAGSAKPGEQLGAAGNSLQEEMVVSPSKDMA